MKHFLATIENISNVDPRTISIFIGSSLGRSITQNFNQTILDNFVEIPIFILGEEDGSFDANDKIIFYGRGPSGFDYNQRTLEWNQNLYFNENSCMLFIPYDSEIRGKRIIYSITT